MLLDEATVAIGARDIVRNHTPMWDAMSNAPFVWMIGRLLGMAGLASTFWLRFPSAIIGTASIVVLYFIARRLFEIRIALFSAFLFAIHPFAVAFSRVLFADPFQLFFILFGILSFERYFEYHAISDPKKWRELLYLLIIWGLAFTMKYNAIVPGAVWLFCGIVSGRYKILPACIAFVVMGVGSFGTLLLWPYDATVWFFAFMGKAGSYNFHAALDFYRVRLHLVLFPIITEIIFPAALIIAWFLWKKEVQPEEKAENKNYAKSIVHLTSFLLLQTAVLITLGRMFERYLLVMVPFACALVPALISLSTRRIIRWRSSWLGPGWEPEKIDRIRPKRSQVVWFWIVFAMWWIFANGFGPAYHNYYRYLKNDVDYTSLAQTVRTSQQMDTSRRAFWLMPEPIASYYLGYTQRYSRAIYPDYDAPNSHLNYFDFAAVPRSSDWKGDKVLAIRGLARAWGWEHILTSPNKFIAAARRVSDSVSRLPGLPVANYLDSDFVHTGDLLVMQSGFVDLQGEPILEDIQNEGGPPYLSHLPVENYSITRVYRPDGFAPVTDTTMERVRAGAWLLVRK